MLFWHWLPGQQLLSSIKTYHSHSYYEEDGLASNMVYEMAQSADGLMWFATQKGISTFDGLRWNTFKQDFIPQASDHLSLVPLEDGGMIYASSAFGKIDILHFNKNQWKRLSLPPDLPEGSGLDNTRIAVHEYLPNQFLLAINLKKKLFLYNSSDSLWQIFKIPENFSCDEVENLHFFREELFFLTKKRMHSFNLQTHVFDQHPVPALKNEPVLNAANSRDGRFMYLLGYNFVGRLNKEKDYINLIDTIYEEAPNDLFYQNILLDKNDRLFFNHHAALFKYNLQTHELEPIKIDNPKSDAIPTDILEDAEGNIWFSTLRGVNKINSFRFHSLNKSNGLVANEVSTIIPINPSSLLLAGNHGFSILKEDTIINHSEPVKNYNSSLNRVLDATVSPHGITYLAANGRGVGVLGLDNSITWFPPSFPELVTTVAFQHDSLLVGTSKGKIFLFDNGKYIPYLTLPETYIRKIIKSDDSLILLTNFGLFKILNGSEVQCIQQKENQLNNLYSYINWKGRTILGTMGGLTELIGDSIVKVKERGLKIDRPVYALLEDAQGRLWAGTDKGVYVHHQGNFINYNLHHGLSGKEINRNAFQLMPDGKIWIGTDQGVSVYNSMDDMEKRTLPKVRISSLLVPNKKPLSPAQPLELAHHQNTLEVSFQAISFSNPTDLQFRYRLEGLEENWIYADNHLLNRVRYPDLSAGNYRFVIQAGPENGQWSKTAKSALISVLPPFYASGWFLLIALAAISSVGYIAHALLTHRKNEQKLKEAIEQKKIEVEKSEKRFRAVWDATDTGIALVDRAGKVLMANPSLCSLLRTEVSSACGTPFFNLMPITLFKEENLQKLYREKSTCKKDISIKLHEQTYYLLITISFIDHLIQGESLMIIGCKDVTSQRMAETKNIRLNEKLLQQNTSLIKKEEELANYNHELLQQREELEQALKAVEERNYELDQFVYKTSHDLRAPIASAMGLLNLIEMESDHGRLPEYLKLIGNALEKQDGFIKAMLNFSRTTRSRNKAEGVNFKELTEQVLEDLQHLTGFEEMDKQLNISPGTTAFHSDNTKLYIVLSNVISNSIKYRDPFKKSYVRISVNINKAGAEVVVQDNGIGIPKEHISHVFDMFYRATDLSDGSGLGLYIVKQTISKLRGHICITANRGEGTTVSLFVPCQQNVDTDAITASPLSSVDSAKSV